jgi:L-rhamnose-H+ transport protein
MGLLWGASIFLYGAATPRLGRIGPSIGWPLSLAVALLVANLMGVWLGEWRAAPVRAVRLMRTGIGLLLAAIVLCALSSSLGGA